MDDSAAIGTSGATDDPAALATLARRVLPGGSFGNFAAEPIIREGRASHVWDVAGREYIDYLIGSGPMIVGHCHPDVTAAVQAQVAKGTTFFANSPPGILLAEMIVEAVPCAEKVRFVSSGSEADLYAMRLARAFRKRDKILKFEGGYHGMSDYGLMSLAPRVTANFPTAVPDSPGIPEAVRHEMLVTPYNDLATVTAMLREHADEIGGVIVEPCQRIIPPQPGFLQGLRAITAELGIPLIFDEVVTGFRYAYGGAQEFYGVVPDICTLGKVCGGGFPLAAIAGKEEIMTLFDKEVMGEDKFLTQIGTLSGNPVASAAGLATMKIMRAPGSYERLFATGRTLMAALTDALRRHGIPGQVVGEPPMFDVVFAEGPMRDYRDVQRGDKALNKRFNALLRERGILKSEGKHYVSLSLTEQDVKDTCDAYDWAMARLTA
ncbi:MAG: aminotransferase class III-fold pyridoxal phosphate-dependent enzyme [Proteobacteria bacterium]|nr:aminotransferase class III-fold pyridoxal phosphate-dependent enzyme [Pseudomonadota bacterium]